MPETRARRVVGVKERRQGRRALSAYESQARGIVDRSAVGGVRLNGERRTNVFPLAGDVNAFAVYALVSPWLNRRTQESPRAGASMKKTKPSIQSLEQLTLEEAVAYVEFAKGDDLAAAVALATDRNRLDGSKAVPDEAEVHHALFLLCRARGKRTPSFDEIRIQLRARAAA